MLKVCCVDGVFVNVMCCRKFIFAFVCICVYLVNLVLYVIICFEFVRKIIFVYLIFICVMLVMLLIICGIVATFASASNSSRFISLSS